MGCSLADVTFKARHKKRNLSLLCSPSTTVSRYPPLVKALALRGLCSQARLGFSLSAVFQDDLLFPGASRR